MPAVLLCLGLIAAACGDDDASTAEGTTDAAATTISRVESTTTSTSSTTTATSTPPTTAPASPRPTGEVNPYRDTIEYQPGVHLWVDEPGPCGDTLRPAIVTPGLYITPELVDHGYVVVSIDGRGTPGRGRAWERSIKGDLIELPLQDQAKALEALGRRFGELDLSRVGIHG
ncbi:MAG: prolyl oligopeptidase family serine peptidase, partial [Acidimicrobiales bacterium]